MVISSPSVTVPLKRSPQLISTDDSGVIAHVTASSQEDSSPCPLSSSAQVQYLYTKETVSSESPIAHCLGGGVMSLHSTSVPS